MFKNGKDTCASWKELLDSAIKEPGLIHEAYSRFWNYSLNNQISALMQCKDRNLQPGPIATFLRWKELGRFVRRGEKALVLCMPVTVKSKLNTESSSGDPGPDEPASKTSSARTIFVFKPNWFVLAQTDGEPFTAPPSPIWDRGLALAKLGVQEVPFDQMDGNCQGYATQDRKVAVSPLAVLPHKTLFHELAHILLGHTAESSMSDGEITPKSLREVEAECVALICCESLDLPGVEYARGYIQHWLVGGDIPETSARKVIATADQVLKAGMEH
jgi:hypothetical protein